MIWWIALAICIINGAVVLFGIARAVGIADKHAAKLREMHAKFAEACQDRDRMQEQADRVRGVFLAQRKRLKDAEEARDRAEAERDQWLKMTPIQRQAAAQFARGEEVNDDARH